MNEPQAPGGGNVGIPLLEVGVNYEFLLLNGYSFVATFIRGEPEQPQTGRTPVVVVSRGEMTGWLNLSAIAAVWEVPQLA